MATLYGATDNIVSAIMSELADAAAQDGSGLQDLRTIVRGDRARPMPALPSLWVVPDVATFEQLEFGTDEQWRLDISLAAVFKSTDPSNGAREAQRLAAYAAKYALTTRDEIGSFVLDIRPVSYDPTARSSEKNRTLFWSDAVIRVSFTVDGTDDVPFGPIDDVIILDGGETGG